MVDQVGSNRRYSNINPAYRVIISSSVHGDVVGKLPDEINLGVSADWDYILNNSIAGNLAEAGAQNVFDVSLRNQKTTLQQWTGNSPIELSIPLEFVAEENAAAEVISPIRRLSKMALPRNLQDYGFFTPPGPRLEDVSRVAGDIISVQLGNFMRFSRVAVIDVAQGYKGRLSVEGIPMRAACTVTFRTTFAITGSDYDQFFLM